MRKKKGGGGGHKKKRRKGREKRRGGSVEQGAIFERVFCLQAQNFAAGAAHLYLTL